ncbi:MAG: rhodanese-like domain-containing protein [Polyangiaceae bacterium]
MQRRQALAWMAGAGLGLAALAACSKASAPASELRALTVDEVAARIAANDGKTFIYDNNPQDRFVKSHVPGAKWLEYDRIAATDLPADKGATLVFYCASEL